MITVADEIFIDFSTSCTRDVAVAKLLGWMQGPIRRKYINVTEDGISEDQLPYLHRMDEPINDQLLELREAAQQRLYKAFEADDVLSSDESRQLISDAADEVERHSQKIYLAAKYFHAIDDELAKGPESKLRIDTTATITLSDPYISLSSLDAWAKETYKFSIFVQDDAPPTVESVIDQLKKQQDASCENDDLGKVKANNVYITLAFFVEAFAKTQSKFTEHGEPNAIAIGKHFSDVIFKANNDNKLSGQSDENIRKLIALALKSKKAMNLKRS